jgi:hypothetical protein
MAGQPCVGRKFQIPGSNNQNYGYMETVRPRADSVNCRTRRGFRGSIMRFARAQDDKPNGVIDRTLFGEFPALAGSVTRRGNLPADRLKAELQTNCRELYATGLKRRSFARAQDDNATR